MRMAQNQKQIDISRLLAAKSEIQRDLRDQVSMCAPYLKNYNQPVVVLSRERLRKNVQRFHKALPTVQPHYACLLYTSPSPRDGLLSRMPSSA